MIDVKEFLEKEQFVWLFMWYNRIDGIQNEPRNWFTAFQDVENAIIRREQKTSIFQSTGGIQDASIQRRNEADG